MFAALFSDEETYKCQIERLMQRAESLSEIYDQKYDLMIENVGCGTETKVNLMILEHLLEGYDNPSELNTIGEAAYNLEFTNDRSDCRLW